MAKIKVGTYKPVEPSKNYLLYAPCYQVNTSTAISDLSGKQNDLNFNQGKSALSTAEVWSVANKASTIYGGSATTAKGFFLPAEDINTVDFSKKEGVIILCTVTVTTPAANTGFIAQGSSTTDTGLRVGITTGNVLKPSFYSAAEQIFFPDSAAISNGVATRVLLFFGGSSATGLKYACYLNEASAQAALSTGTATGSIAPTGRTEPLYFGMYKITTNAYSSLTANFSSIHVIKVENTDNITFTGLKDLAIRYKMSPDTMLSYGDVP